MRSSSPEFKNQEGGNLLKIAIHWVDDAHTPLELTYDHLSAFSYSGNGTQTSYMTFGCASICTFDATIINTSGVWDNIRFKGAKAILYLGKRLPTGDEYIKIGKFTIENGIKNEGAINLTAEDNMALLDVRFKGIAFPCTIRDLITRACTQVGIQLATVSFPNANKIVDTLDNVTQFTCREIISLACELAGSFAIINSEGDLELRWFDTSALPIDLDSSYITSCKPEEALTPTGLSAYFSSGDEFLFGSDLSPLYITEDHLLLRNVTGPDKEALLEELFLNRISTLSYDAGTLETKGNCLIEPGDVVQFRYKDKIYKFIVAAIKLSGNLKMTITSTAPTSTSSTSSGGGLVGGGSRGDGSSLQVAHMLSTEDAALNPGPSLESTVELISVFITQAGNFTPVAMFTTTFEYLSNQDIVAKLRITLSSGEVPLHSFDQNCHVGSNMISFSWPLVDLPQGSSKINVKATVINVAQNSPQFIWKSGDTSLIVIGRGFTSVSTWNGLIFLTDTFRRLGNISHIRSGLTFPRLKDQLSGGRIMTYKQSPNSVAYKAMRLTPEHTHKDTLSFNKVAEHISLVTEDEDL